jgi:large subunit ribosomal protein L18
MTSPKQQFEHRRRRVRAKISGTAVRPRLSVKVSNRHVVAQLVDDTAGKTLVYVTTAGKDVPKPLSGQAAWAGTAVAKAAQTKKIKPVVFDRGGKVYSSRMRALAEAAREGGLEF